MNHPVYAPSKPPQRARLRSEVVLLLDASGSMAAGTPRRIDLLWQMVQALRTSQSGWRVAVFNSYCRWSAVAAVPEPDGDTDLAGAFEVIGKVNPLRVTVITDGQPNDTEAAFAAGVHLGCPVHILFVGESGDEDALAFCRRLCEATKGTFATEVLTLTSLAQTTATVKGMLGDGTKPSTAIAL
jgi:Mg-chelatase subunit ChlD